MKNYQQPRFLITRLSAIGDCILTMPLACALRDAFPQAWIGWLAEGGGASLLQGHPALDEVIVSPKHVLHSPRQTWQLRSKLRSLNIGTTLDPQGLFKSAIMGWLSGAKRRIGFRAPVGRECSNWMNNTLVKSREPHVVDRYRELLQPLDVQPTTVRFDVPRQSGATQVVASWLDQQRLAKQPFAVINPGAGWGSKIWPAERYTAIAHTLHREHGLPSVVVFAGGREKSWAEQIVAGSHGGACLAPHTTLPELAALLRHSRLFVGSDTGPLHLAAAVGVPCVGVYGPTPPTECGPYGPGHRTVQTYLQAGSCRERRKAENLAMQAVTVEQVAAACHDALTQTALSRAA